jgi:hypothetical protein
MIFPSGWMVRAFSPEIDPSGGMVISISAWRFALFVQYFNAVIEKFCLLFIVDEIGIVKLNSIRTWTTRNLLEFQVLRGNRKPIFLLGTSRHYGNCYKGQEQEQPGRFHREHTSKTL